MASSRSAPATSHLPGPPVQTRRTVIGMSGRVATADAADQVLAPPRSIIIPSANRGGH